MTTARFALEVPGQAEHLATVRIFAASLARRFGFGEEAIADLKLALSEAATLALRDADDPIKVSAVPVAGGLDFTIAVASDTLEADDELGGLDLIRALFADAAATPGGIRIPVRRPVA